MKIDQFEKVDNKRRKERSLSPPPRRTKQLQREDPLREDYKYQVIAGDCEKLHHSDPLSVRPGEVVTVRNICPAHQNCGFIQVINQFSETGFVQKKMLQSCDQADTSFCFFCKETFSCPQGFEEHLCMEHFYEELKQHITKEQQHQNQHDDTASNVSCPERDCSRHSDYLDEIILHYGVEHHRVQSLAFNQLRQSDEHLVHRNHRLEQQQTEESKNKVDDQDEKVKRLEKMLVEKTQEISKLELKVSTKEEQLKEFYYYNLTKKNEELKKQIDLVKKLKET